MKVMCTKCGFEQEIKFCSNCGAILSQERKAIQEPRLNLAEPNNIDRNRGLQIANLKTNGEKRLRPDKEHAGNQIDNTTSLQQRPKGLAFKIIIPIPPEAIKKSRRERK